MNNFWSGLVCWLWFTVNLLPNKLKFTNLDEYWKVLICIKWNGWWCTVCFYLLILLFYSGELELVMVFFSLSSIKQISLINYFFHLPSFMMILMICVGLLLLIKWYFSFSLVEACKIFKTKTNFFYLWIFQNDFQLRLLSLILIHCNIYQSLNMCSMNCSIVIWLICIYSLSKNTLVCVCVHL